MVDEGKRNKKRNWNPGPNFANIDSQCQEWALGMELPCRARVLHHWEKWAGQSQMGTEDPRTIWFHSMSFHHEVGEMAWEVNSCLYQF